MSKSAPVSTSYSSGTTSSIPSEVEKRERSISDDKASQLYVNVITDPPESTLVISREVTPKKLKSYSDIELQALITAAKAGNKGGDSNPLFISLIKELVRRRHDKKLKSHSDDELHAHLTASREKIKASSTDHRFVPLIKELVRRSPQTFSFEQLAANIAANLERTTVMVSGEEETFLALNEEQFDEKCHEFLKLLELFCTAVTLPETREHVWNDLLEIWSSCKAYAQANDKSFTLCLEKFIDKLDWKDEPHREKLLELFLSFLESVYLSPTKEITALFDSDLQKSYSPENVRLQFHLDEEITLTVSWEVKIQDEGTLLFSHTLETSREKLPHWDSSLSVEFQADDPGKSDGSKYLLPLRRAGLIES